MSAAEAAKEIAEIAADGVADGLHIVSDEALAAERIVQGMESMRLAYFGLGVAIGGVVSGLIAFRVAYRKSEAKYSAIAEEEIDGMRQHYHDKTLAFEAEKGKKELKDLVAERGYAREESTEAPMAVTPPKAVVTAAAEAAEQEEDVAEDELEEELVPEPEVRNIFRDRATPANEWDWHKERSRRTPMQPFVVHVDERDNQTAFESVTYTYFEGDDVLCNERDEVIDQADRERIVGEDNLDKFGHGSGDVDTVFIRNPVLEMDVEIVRSRNSYAEEVHGFEPPEPTVRRGRAPIDDD